MASGSKDVSAIYELMYNPNYVPRPSPSAHIEKLTADGEPMTMLVKEPEHDYYEIDPTTAAVWGLMDGRRTVQSIFNEAKRSDDTVTEKGVRDTLVSLADEGMIESTEPEVIPKRVEVVSAFQVDLHLIRDSSKTLAGFFRATRKIIGKEDLYVAVGIALVGLFVFYGSFLQIFANPSVFDLAGSALLGFFFYQMLVLLPEYAIHELAHAAVCDYYGAKPREIGTGLYYLAPFFYCDTSDSWRLNRKARVMISLAGPLSTVVISALLVFWSFFVPPGFFQNVLKISAFFGYYGTLINFSPVIETDGYYILADALNIPNLRDEAFGFVKRSFLKAFGRPVKAVRQGKRHRQIVLLYSVITFLWLAYFAFTTTWLLSIYSRDAYSALVSLSLSILRVNPFNLTAVGVDVAALSYFALLMAGYVVMAAVASRNIRMKGVKLEVIHDKRVSAFLPLPSTLPRSQGMELVGRARKLASSYSRSYSVTLEPPLCVAALKLGKVDQSLEGMRTEMLKIDQSFRSLHRGFVSRRAFSEEGSSRKKAMEGYLVNLAAQFPSRERNTASTSVRHLMDKQDEAVTYLLESAFGTVWTMELGPDDYKRIKRRIFPSLVAEDLSLTGLPPELEDFKKRYVLDSDTRAQLSSEIEEESREVKANPEVYQITALFEPMKSRLVFLGRTDRVEGSVVWLGGLFLYQAWTSYMGAVLRDATLGLRSLRLANPNPITKTEAGKMSDKELEMIEQDCGRMEVLAKTVDDALIKVGSTFESAVNFHETLDSLVSDESFDIGLYKPIISSNSKHLESVKEVIEDFRSEFGKVSKREAAAAEQIREERSRRASEPGPRKVSPGAQGQSSLSRLFGGSRNQSLTFEVEVKLMFATTRLVYGPVVGSDIIL